jgi:hypothetical protein
MDTIISGFANIIRPKETWICEINPIYITSQ